jgi:uncharacterized membrane protein YeaQ/YmgE (transglycosylase-associated protein family)
MGIIAWIVLGLLVGIIAKFVVPGRDAHGLVVTTLIGIGGALLGGFIATKVFHRNGIEGFFNLSTWLIAIAGAAVLLLIFHLFENRGSGGSGRGFSRR